MHQMLSEKVPNKDIAEAPEGTPYLSEYDWGYDEKTIGWDQAEVADKEDQEEYYHKLQFLILILLHVIFDIITQKELHWTNHQEDSSNDDDSEDVKSKSIRVCSCI